MVLEEAKLDDLFNLIASETGQEIHKLMQVIDNIGKDNVEKIMNEADAVRALRQEHERDFFGINKGDVEKVRRSGIGEGGCDFKHCCINFMHCLEVAQKELRMWTKLNEKEKKLKKNEMELSTPEKEEREKHKNRALLYLRGARMYKEMAFKIRDKFKG